MMFRRIGWLLSSVSVPVALGLNGHFVVQRKMLRIESGGRRTGQRGGAPGDRIAERLPRERIVEHRRNSHIAQASR